MWGRTVDCICPSPLNLGNAPTVGLYPTPTRYLPLLLRDEQPNLTPKIIIIIIIIKKRKERSSSLDDHELKAFLAQIVWRIYESQGFIIYGFLAQIIWRIYGFWARCCLLLPSHCGRDSSQKLSVFYGHSTHQCTIHWMPVLTQLWMDDPQLSYYPVSSW